MKRPLIYGHRGLHREAPENTLEAFLAAERSGADGVELDVRITADGIPVVTHNPEFTAPWGTSLAVAAITASEALRAGIPTLETILAGIGDGTGVNIEIKAEPDIPTREAGRLVRAVAAVLARQKGQRVPVISSFHPKVIDRIKELLPQIPAGWLIKPFTAYKGRPKRYDFVHPHYLLAHPLFILWQRLKRRRIYAWTVNSPLVALFLALFGVDGLITDRPDDFLRIFPLLWKKIT